MSESLFITPGIVERSGTIRLPARTRTTGTLTRPIMILRLDGSILRRRFASRAVAERVNASLPEPGLVIETVRHPRPIRRTFRSAPLRTPLAILRSIAAA